MLMAEQEQQRIGGERGHPGGERIGRPVEGQHPAEHCGRGNDDEDGPDRAQRREHLPGEGGDAELAIKKPADHDHGDHAEHGGFRGRGDAGEDAAQHDDGNGEHRQADDGRLYAFAVGHALFARVAVALGHEIGLHHQEQPEHGAGNGAAEEQPPDGFVRRRGEQDEGDRRRNERPDGRRAGDQGRRVADRVTAALHRRDKEAPGRGRIRQVRARHARHDDVDDHADVGKPAGDVSRRTPWRG